MNDSSFRISDQVLMQSRRQWFNMGGWSLQADYQYLFDFEFRTLTVLYRDSQDRNNAQVMLFSQVERDMLEQAHDRLVELGGKPSPLSGETLSKIRLATSAPKPGAMP